MEPSDLKIGERFQEETKYFRPSAVSLASDKRAESSLPKIIPLSPPELFSGLSLWEILRKRRSIRDYSKEPILLSELAGLLWATQGLTMKAPAPWFRTVPSAGALHPIDTYLVVNRVRHLPSGIYWLHVEDFALELKKEGDFSTRVARAALDQDVARSAAVVFLWVAVIPRSSQKYRQRAYRYIYLDCGHIAQNLYLASTAMNLGCCAIAAFFDEEMNRLVGVDGTEATTLYLATIGRKGQTEG